MTRTRRHALFFVLMFAAVACPQQTAVWIQPGSNSGHLSFLMSHKRGGSRGPAVGRLLVAKCGRYYSAEEVRAAAVWDIESAEPGALELRAVTYGVLPPGFKPRPGASDTALTLTPGCYDIDIGGSPGWTRFHVDSSGAVHEDSLADRWSAK